MSEAKKAAERALEDESFLLHLEKTAAQHREIAWMPNQARKMSEMDDITECDMFYRFRVRGLVPPLVRALMVARAKAERVRYDTLREIREELEAFPDVDRLRASLSGAMAALRGRLGKGE